MCYKTRLFILGFILVAILFVLKPYRISADEPPSTGNVTTQPQSDLQKDLNVGGDTLPELKSQAGNEVPAPGADVTLTPEQVQNGISSPTPTSTSKVTTKVACPSDGPHGLIDPNCTLAENLNHLYPITVRIIVLLAFLAVINAGYIYITSFGQPARIEEAKNWVVAAVTGLALILLIPVILNALDSVKSQLPGN